MTCPTIWQVIFIAREKEVLYGKGSKAQRQPRLAKAHTYLIRAV
jgi:hypothetical protein